MFSSEFLYFYNLKIPDEMNLSFILKRSKNIILQPEQEWSVILDEDHSIAEISKGFVLPLVTTGAITKFMGLFLFGGAHHFFSSLIYSLSFFVSVYGAYYLSSQLADQLAPSFGTISSKLMAHKMIAYSLIPVYWSGILANLFPESLFFLKILYFYSIILVWQSSGFLINIPESKKLGFVAIMIVVLFLIIEAINQIFINLFSL